MESSATTAAQGPLRVVICGGGVIGAATAFYLAQLGVAATVVERESVACAASGKAGGFLALDWCDSSPVGPLARKSFALHEQLATDLGVDVGYRKVHTLQVSASETAPAGAGASKLRVPLPDWLDGSVTKASVLGDFSNTAQVHPFKLTNALMDAAVAKAGARVVTGEVTGVEVSDNRVTGVLVGGTSIPADCVVIAMGPWSGAAAAWLPVPHIGGTKAASVLLRPAQPFTDTMLFTAFRTAAGKNVEPEVYPRPDGTVYVCGATPDISLPASAGQVTVVEESAQDLLRYAAALSSRLAGATVEAKQSCYLPGASDGLPVIGALTVKGGYVASGHTCWGILNGPATGLAMAELIVNGAATSVDIAPFSPARFGRVLRSKARP